MNGLGTTLRAIREAAGMSLSGMASRTNFSKSYLGLVETGCRRPTPQVVAAYEKALGDSVDRRSLLAGFIGGAVAPTAMFEGIRKGYETALNEPRPHVNEWLGRVESYGRDYMSVGAGELQARLAGDLIVLQTKLDSSELWGVAARLLTIHGKTLPSADESGAIRWYKLAATASDRSHDPAVRVWVRGRAALALAYEGAGLPVAQVLAEQALALSDRPSLGRLNATMAMAHVAAHRGDTATALATMEDGRRVFDIAGSQEQISDFAVPEWRMSTFTSMLLSRLGDPRAMQEQENADRTRPAELPRFATHIELHRGLMLAKAGDPAGGLAYARSALAKLPPEKHSLSLRMLLDEVRAAGASWSPTGQRTGVPPAGTPPNSGLEL